MPSLLLRDKRDFAAKGALIIRGVAGARSWIWHQTLISASPPYSSDCRVHVPSGRCRVLHLSHQPAPSKQRGEKGPFYLDGGLTAGPLLLPGSPGILAESCSRTPSLFPEPVVALKNQHLCVVDRCELPSEEKRYEPKAALHPETHTELTQRTGPRRA